MTDHEWDNLIAPWQGCMIYHHSAWLRFIADSTPGLRLIRFRVVENNVTAGYFAGFIAQKGPFLVLGSPLYGWNTDFMGPISDEQLDLPKFLHTMESWCRRNHIHFLQMGHPALPEEAMRQAGYLVNRMSHYQIPLSTSEERMWQQLRGKCRNRIRKGIANGLSVEKCDDSSIVQEFYAQHTDVFARQALAPNYPLSTVHSLVRNLLEAEGLLALRIRSNGETIATGLFPHDNSHLHSFGIASWGKERAACPNELLYWSAMQWGGRHGLQSFTIGGQYRQSPSGGVFKQKFNGELVPFLRYAKALSPPLNVAYRAYGMWRDFRSRHRAPWDGKIREKEA